APYVHCREHKSPRLHGWSGHIRLARLSGSEPASIVHNRISRQNLVTGVSLRQSLFALFVFFKKGKTAIDRAGITDFAQYSRNGKNRTTRGPEWVGMGR